MEQSKQSTEDKMDAARRFLLIFAAVMACSMPTLAAQSLRDWRRLAGEMVDKEIVAAGVKNERVIRAMRDTPRHEFVPVGERDHAYLDMALPIGNSQTISPPFVVASMTEAIDPQPGDRVLEIGTGSGYQAAVLSPLVRDVYTIEIVEPAQRSRDPHTQAAWLQKRPHTRRRWLPRMVRGRALRQDHRHLLAGRGAQAARRPIERGRPDGRSRRRALPPDALPHAQDRRQIEIRSACGPRSSFP